MPESYLGCDNKAHKARKIFVGINGKARECMKAYVGINGKAKQIFPRILEIPYVNGTYTFNKQEQSADIRDVDYQYVDISGDVKATHANTYTITASIKSYYKPYITWSDGTVEDKILTWTINPYILPAPQCTSSIHYGTYGNYRYLQWNFGNIIGDDWNLYIYASDGVTQAGNVGTYPITLTSRGDYLFEGNISAQTTWEIKKATLRGEYRSLFITTGGSFHLPFVAYNNENEYISRHSLTHTMTKSDPNRVIISISQDTQWDYIVYDGSTYGASERTGTATVTVTIPETDSYFSLSMTSTIKVQNNI